MGSQQDLDQFELGWLVGILEGEGHFRFDNTQKIEIGMCDEDSVNRLAAIFEKFLGCEISVKGKFPSQENRQVSYHILLSGDRARKVMRLVVRHMSIRRRQCIWQCLNSYRPKMVKLDLTELGLVKDVA